MICVTIHYHIFELHHSIIMNMVLSFYPFSFYEYFLCFPWSMAPFWRCSYSRLSLNSWDKLTSLFSVVIRISQTYRLSWDGFFCLFPGTYTCGYCKKVCYRINFKLWMKYCACWNCDDMMFGLLIPIPIIVYLHRKKILCFNNQFTSSYNLSINCCVLL